MKIIATLCLALSLGGCAIPAALAPVAPAPLAATTIDDRALSAAWKSHELLQDAINLYLDAKPAAVGTPAARRVAAVNDAITAALTAAESAAAAGSTTNYLTALADAGRALAEMRGALATLKGK